MSHKLFHKCDIQLSDALLRTGYIAADFCFKSRLLGCCVCKNGVDEMIPNLRNNYLVFDQGY